MSFHTLIDTPLFTRAAKFQHKNIWLLSCLFNSLFRLTINQTSKLHNPQVTSALCSLRGGVSECVYLSLHHDDYQEWSSSMESHHRTIHIICNLIPTNVGLWTGCTWQGGQDQWWLIGQAWLLVEWNINNLHRSGLQTTGTPSQLTYCTGIVELINTVDSVYMFTGCFAESSQQFDSASHDNQAFLMCWSQLSIPV